MLACHIIDFKSIEDINSRIQSLPFGEDEACRLFSIGGKERRCESACALICLEKLLEILGLRAHEIKRDATGRPFFDAPRAPDFSLSHTDGFCLAVLSDISGSRVGADIELIRPHGRAAALAERFFKEDEREYLARSDDKPRAFFELWTRKEAAAKLYGEGLASILSGESKASPLTAHTRALTLGEHTLAMSACSTNKDEPIQIFFNGVKL